MLNMSMKMLRQQVDKLNFGLKREAAGRRGLLDREWTMTGLAKVGWFQALK